MDPLPPSPTQKKTFCGSFGGPWAPEIKSHSAKMRHERRYSRKVIELPQTADTYMHHNYLNDKNPLLLILLNIHTSTSHLCPVLSLNHLLRIMSFLMPIVKHFASRHLLQKDLDSTVTTHLPSHLPRITWTADKDDK